MLEPELTHSIIGAFYEVYKELGYGFVESVYAAAMERELRSRDHRVAREVSVRIHYNGSILARQRLDFVVDDRVVVELESGAQ